MIQYAYSCEFSIGESTSETPMLILYKALSYLMSCISSYLNLEMNFQFRKLKIVWSWGMSGECGQYSTCTILCFTKTIYSKVLKIASEFSLKLIMTCLDSSLDIISLLLTYSKLLFKD